MLIGEILFRAIPLVNRLCAPVIDLIIGLIEGVDRSVHVFDGLVIRIHIRLCPAGSVFGLERLF
jgi:hypothetical protein